MNIACPRIRNLEEEIPDAIPDEPAAIAAPVEDSEEPAPVAQPSARTNRNGRGIRWATPRCTQIRISDAQGIETAMWMDENRGLKHLIGKLCYLSNS